MPANLNKVEKGGRPQPRVLMLGPASSMTGGMVSVIKSLAKSILNEHCNLVVLNTGKTRPERSTFLRAIWVQVRLLSSVFATIRSRGPVLQSGNAY